MAVRGIVVRPMNERRPAATVVHQFAAYRYSVATLDRYSRRELHVIDDFECRAVVGPTREGLVHRMGVRTVEKMWR